MKTMRIAKTTFLTLLSLSLFCGEQSKAEFFLQAELGTTQVDDAIRIDFINTRIDGNAAAMRIAAGYQFNTHFSAETGYVEFGRYSGVIATNKWFASANGQDVVLTAHIPANDRLNFEVFGGVLMWDGDVSFDVTSGDTSGEDIMFGIGARYRIGDRFDIGIRLARYRLEDEDLRYGSATMRIYF